MIEEAKYYPTNPEEPHAKVLYELDNYKNPYNCFRQMGQPGRYTNPNNITRETHILYQPDNPGIVENQSVVNYQYKYNLRGYPVKINNAKLVYR